MSRIAEALTLLKDRGWRRGPDARPSTGGWENQLCMHLALCDAYHVDGSRMIEAEEFTKDIAAISSVCREQFPDLTVDLCDDDAVFNVWAVNDAEGQTFDQVERIMEKAYIHRCSEL